MEIIDLSMPIGPHFRWSPEIKVKGDIAAGDQFRVTHLATTCHGFSHVDAQAHFVAGAPTIEATPLSRVVGPARVFNLRDLAPNTAIDAARLAKSDPGEWLLARKPTAVAFDFPQDYPIRLLLDGHIAPTPEHVTHDVLLRAGVTLIEYLVNTSALKGPRTFLCAAPLKIPGADAAPARVFAIEGLNL